MIYFVTLGSGSLLPEVLVLAESLAAVVPEQRFVWLVSDSWSSGLSSALRSIPGASAELWQTQLQTAGATPSPAAEIPLALLDVTNRPDCRWAVYCAPGVLWLSPPTEVFGDASGRDVVLLPNLLRPQDSRSEPVCELEALMQGIFTHRFVAGRSSVEGRAFLAWWQERLLCTPVHDRSPESWLHLAPALFPSVRILRSPRFNIHRGNLHERRLDGSFPRITIDDMPVAFFDLGAPGAAAPTDHDVDPQTECAFRSARHWYEHRKSNFAESRMANASSTLSTLDRS